MPWDADCRHTPCWDLPPCRHCRECTPSRPGDGAILPSDAPGRCRMYSGDSVHPLYLFTKAIER